MKLSSPTQGISSLLSLQHLTVKVGEKTILHDLSMDFAPGSFHVILGPNGSGKSTLASFLAGHPDYVAATDSQVTFGGQNLLSLSADQRSRAGLFLAFQQPVMVPGLRVLNFLWLTYQRRFSDAATRPQKTIVAFRDYLKTLAVDLDLKPELIDRGLHEGFSGGEKKRLEVLQLMVLQPKLAILDEIDSGLDVDALKLTAAALHRLQNEIGTTILLITHHQQIVRTFKPDQVRVLIQGKLVASGDMNLLEQIEAEGFNSFKTLATEVS
ncbi:MAG TPA: Fe-S cluster assembly ATPase SufC [Candidatus Pacebacteria bacterium]|nr:Fe-S cluster assembly ATPase SufC [Candidatus Paceibacterota bacterium]